MPEHQSEIRKARLLGASAGFVTILVAQIFGMFWLSSKLSAWASTIFDAKYVVSTIAIGGSILFSVVGFVLAFVVWQKLCDRLLSEREREKLSADFQRLDND